MMKYNFLNSESMDSIQQELLQHIEDNIKSFNSEYSETDLHHVLFNEDYYLIGYHKCDQWLKNHNISVFDGIAFVQDYERDNFGNDAVKIYDNAETLVNMIVFIMGENAIYQYFKNQKCLEEIFNNDPFGLLD